VFFKPRFAKDGASNIIKKKVRGRVDIPFLLINVLCGIEDNDCVRKSRLIK
jgi:hypothetical protein